MASDTRSAPRPYGAGDGAYLEGLCLRAQPLGAELHHRVGTERIADFVLTDGKQPQGRVGFQLRRWDEDGLVPRVHTAGETG